MTAPEDPWADPEYRPEPGPPMDDRFYRAIGEYVARENAKTAEPGWLSAYRDAEAEAG